MKLRNPNEGLSDSLLNNSQIKDDSTPNKLDTFKSQLVLKAVKQAGQLNQKKFEKIVDEGTADVSVLTKENKKLKRRQNVEQNLPEDHNPKESLDFIKPKKRIKVALTKPGIPRSSKTKSIEILNKSIGRSSRVSSVSNGSNITTKSCSSNNVESEYKFATPPPISRKTKFITPMHQSSPKPGAQNKNVSNKTPDSDSFSSVIIRSSEEFTSTSREKTAISPVLKSVNKNNQISRKTPKRKCRSMPSKKISIDNTVASTKSIALSSEPVVRTRSGRVSVPFRDTELAPG